MPDKPSMQHIKIAASKAGRRMRRSRTDKCINLSKVTLFARGWDSLGKHTRRTHSKWLWIISVQCVSQHWAWYRVNHPPANASTAASLLQIRQDLPLWGWIYMLIAIIVSPCQHFSCTEDLLSLFGMLPGLTYGGILNSPSSSACQDLLCCPVTMIFSKEWMNFMVRTLIAWQTLWDTGILKQVLNEQLYMSYLRAIRKSLTCMCLRIGNSRVAVGSNVFVSPEISQRACLLLDEVMECEAVWNHEVFLDVNEIVHGDIPAAYWGLWHK